MQATKQVEIVWAVLVEAPTMGRTVIRLERVRLMKRVRRPDDMGLILVSDTVTVDHVFTDVRTRARACEVEVQVASFDDKAVPQSPLHLFQYLTKDWYLGIRMVRHGDNISDVSDDRLKPSGA